MMSSDALWAAMQALDGEIITTVGRGFVGPGCAFTVRRSTDTQVIAVPGRGEPRAIKRDMFAYALALDVPVDQLRPISLKDVPAQRATATYVVAILRELHRRDVL